MNTVEYAAPGETPFDTLARFASFDGVSRATVAAKMTPAAIAANTGRIYDWMREVGLACESDTRECLFAFAAHAFGMGYEVFYEAWMAEKPVEVSA